MWCHAHVCCVMLMCVVSCSGVCCHAQVCGVMIRCVVSCSGVWCHASLVGCAINVQASEQTNGIPFCCWIFPLSFLISHTSPCCCTHMCFMVFHLCFTCPMPTSYVLLHLSCDPGFSPVILLDSRIESILLSCDN